jgi:hypothetical protein
MKCARAFDKGDSIMNAIVQILFLILYDLLLELEIFCFIFKSFFLEIDFRETKRTKMTIDCLR